VTWGIADNVVERFVAAGVPKERITCEPDTFVFSALMSPSEFLAVFRDYYGPTMNAFDAAAKDGRADELHKELDVLFNEQNQSDSASATSIPLRGDVVAMAEDLSSSAPCAAGRSSFGA
jgi:hypothetical protein